MQKIREISVLCAIYFAVIPGESSFAAPPIQYPTDSLRNEPNRSSNQEAVVFVYIPRNFPNNSQSRRNYLLEVLTKLSDAVHKSAEVEEEPTPLESENLLKDRLDIKRYRPSLEMGEGESIKPAFVGFPNSEDIDRNRRKSKNSNSKLNISEEGGPLTFQDRHNPNNILQKGSLVPNSPDKNPSSGTPSSPASTTHTESKRKTPEISTSDVIDTKDLTFDILKNSHWSSDNNIISPFSVYNCLALLLLGADGQTFNELALKVRKSDRIQSSDTDKQDRFHSSFRRLLSYLNTNSGSDVSLEIANIMFTDEKYPLKQSFVNDAKEYYDAPVNAIDFATKGEQFKNIANDWVSQKTHGEIENIIQHTPSSTTNFVFINAVYFKGQWETPFPISFTRKKEFFISPSESVLTKLMTNHLNVPYMENENYQMISLPYKDKKTAFFIMLPKEVNGVEGLKSLEASLNSKILSESIRSMKSQSVAVKIPKMKIRTEGQMDDILTRMGLSSMFSPQSANFTRMSEKNGLYISSVYHQACIDLDESGTVASAATAGIGDRTIDEIPITFIANRPFIFFIYHIRAETTLFWGRFIRPQVKE